MSDKKKKYDFSGIDAQERDSRNTKKASTSVGGSVSLVFKDDFFKDVKELSFQKDKSYYVKFVPYVVDGSHPKVQQGKMRAGQMAYVLDFTQHSVGANNTKVLCPKGTFGKSCPICDRGFELRQNDPDSKEAKALKSSRRVAYNIVLIKTNDEKVEADIHNVMVINSSQYAFESPLLDLLKMGNEDAGIEEYHMSDLCVGAEGEDKLLKIKTKEVDSGDFKYIGFDFNIVTNKQELDADELLDKALPLHKGLNILNANDLGKILYGDGILEEDNDDDESDDDDDDDDDDDEPKKSTKKSSKKSKDDDEEDEESEEDDSEESDEEDEEDEDDRPKKSTKKSSNKSKDDDDDEESEDESEESEDDEDDDKPKKSSSGKCPEGFTWGKSCGMKDECDDCKLYKSCNAARKAMKKSAQED